MDAFMDKLAEKLRAGEIIKANRAADIEEMERLQSRVKEYEACLERLAAVKAELDETAQNMGKELSKKASQIELNMQDTRDHVHKESVKVYRNVQAVVVGEAAKQAEQLEELKFSVEELKTLASVKETPGIQKGILAVSIMSLLVSAASLTLWLLSFFGVL